MTAKELKQKYLDFFAKKGHRVIPNASLIPENDPTALFISAGMHPLVPYLLGEPHPFGERLCSVQRCLRTDDIDKVGNTVHHTFFEMLGNWSLGDPASPDGIGQGGYWKKEAIQWSFEFLTGKEWLGIDKNKLAISVFAGDNDAPFDKESYDIWVSLGISDTRIAKLPKKNNWWGPAGKTGPCGPDTEMFVWVGKDEAPKTFNPDDVSWVEIWNDVFMEYEKKLKIKNEKLKNENAREKDFEYVFLKQKNVDTGMGVERTVAVLGGLDDDYQTELFKPIIQSIEVLSGKNYEQEENQKPMRIIADHLRAATFLISDGVTPSNVEQGYVLRRLIRRAVRFGRTLSAKGGQLIKLFTPNAAETVIQTMKGEYPELEKKKNQILETLTLEEEKFKKTLERGLKEIEKCKKLDGKIAFYLYETYGFPLEMIEEIVQERGQKIDKKAFEEEFKKHQETSRVGAEKKFAGGLADHSEKVTKLHTATHLLHSALRKILGEHVKQSGSNITAERLRFDFPNPRKLTEKELKDTEELVNQKIKENLPVEMEMMTLEQAKEKGAMAEFEKKYGEKVKVYSIGDPSVGSGQVFSVEVCGGPHVDFTGRLGRFKIIKEGSAGAGIRRIYATLD
ncbi:MAG: alanine--tRNA ligase [Patescibacteria group bacterium]